MLHTVRTAIISILITLSTACAGLSQNKNPAAATDRCYDLESRYEWTGAISIGATALAGSGAFSTSLPDDRPTRLGLGIMSAALVAVGAAMLFVRDDVLTLYTQECTTDTSTVADE